MSRCMYVQGGEVSFLQLGHGRILNAESLSSCREYRCLVGWGPWLQADFPSLPNASDPGEGPGDERLQLITYCLLSGASAARSGPGAGQGWGS